MASTYEKIATTTLGSAGTVTFSSIPGTYTDIVLISSAKNSSRAGGTYQIVINSDTASNYSATYMQGTGAGANSGRFTNNTVAYTSRSSDPSGSEYAPGIVHFMNYSNTTTYKTLLSRGNEASATTIAFVNLWRSTSAITSISINSGNANFNSGSTFTLYGIKAA
jgi:hypothetical protein